MSHPLVRVSAGLALAVVLSAPARCEDKAAPTYRCQGFDEPMHRENIRISRGRVLPLRAKLVLPNGAFGDATTLKTAPKISLQFLPESGPPVDKSNGIEVRDYGKGNSFVFDQEAHWKFDLGTGNQPENGRYKVSLISGDESEYRVDPACVLVFLLDGGK
jgi:hypothetical protein